MSLALDIQHGIHHPRHGYRRRRPDRHHQAIPQPPRDHPFQPPQTIFNILNGQTAGTLVFGVSLYGDHETGGHSKPDLGHRDQIGPLVSQKHLVFAVISKPIYRGHSATSSSIVTGKIELIGTLKANDMISAGLRCCQ